MLWDAGDLYTLLLCHSADWLIDATPVYFMRSEDSSGMVNEDLRTQNLVADERAQDQYLKLFILPID